MVLVQPHCSRPWPFSTGSPCTTWLPGAERFLCSLFWELTLGWQVHFLDWASDYKRVHAFQNKPYPVFCFFVFCFYQSLDIYCCKYLPSWKHTRDFKSMADAMAGITVGLGHHFLLGISGPSKDKHRSWLFTHFMRRHREFYSCSQVRLKDLKF